MCRPDGDNDLCTMDFDSVKLCRSSFSTGAYGSEFSQFAMAIHRYPPQAFESSHPRRNAGKRTIHRCARHFARSDEEEELIEEFRELDAFTRAAVVVLAEQLFARPLLSRKRGLSALSAAVLVRSIPRLTTASI